MLDRRIFPLIPHHISRYFEKIFFFAPKRPKMAESPERAVLGRNPAISLFGSAAGLRGLHRVSEGSRGFIFVRQRFPLIPHPFSGYVEKINSKKTPETAEKSPPKRQF